LKPYVDDPVVGEGVPLHYYNPGNEPPPVIPKIEEIRGHRFTEDGTIELRVGWANASEDEDSWMPVSDILAFKTDIWKTYLIAKGIESLPLGKLDSEVSLTPSQ
jgi:hypothetical protein